MRYCPYDYLFSSNCIFMTVIEIFVCWFISAPLIDYTKGYWFCWNCHWAAINEMNEDLFVDILWKLLPNYRVIANREWELICLKNKAYLFLPMHIAMLQDEFIILYDIQRNKTAISSSAMLLTHWGRVTHICVGNLTIIGSDNGVSTYRCQAIIWSNAGILSIGHAGTSFSEIMFFTFDVVWRNSAAVRG